MTFTVDWEPPIRVELHYIWAASPNPTAVRAAAEGAEQLLAANPHGHGRHLSEGLWQLRVPPLLVNYTIDDDSRHVDITDVFHTDATP